MVEIQEFKKKQKLPLSAILSGESDPGILDQTLLFM